MGDVYANWRPTGGAELAPRAAVAHAPTRAQLTDAKLMAAFSEDVYRPVSTPPAGWHVASDKELASAGLRPDMLTSRKSDFHARVYVQDAPSPARYAVAFRGTSTAGDWREDGEQAFSMATDSYKHAVDLGQTMGRLHVGAEFTGHSLGGGLASAAAVASGRPAVTFNAAGITPATLERAAQARSAAGGGSAGHVDAFYSSVDPLSQAQDGGGNLIGYIEGGPAGAFTNPVRAYGQRHELTAAVPASFTRAHPTSALLRHPLDEGVAWGREGHSMDMVERGLNKALAEASR